MWGLIAWVRGGCRHAWGDWNAPERITLGQKGRTVTPLGTIILHGERSITTQWRLCSKCGEWNSRINRPAISCRGGGASRMTNPARNRIEETIAEIGSPMQPESTVAAVIAAVFDPWSDDELRSAYLETDGEGPVADLLCAELERRGVDV